MGCVARMEAEGHSIRWMVLLMSAHACNMRCTFLIMQSCLRHILSEMLSVIPFNEQPRDRTGVFFVCYLDHIERRMNIRNP